MVFASRSGHLVVSMETLPLLESPGRPRRGRKQDRRALPARESLWQGDIAVSGAAHRQDRVPRVPKR